MGSTSDLGQPALYGSAADGGLVLRASRCLQCGAVLFPRQTYGCERCGAHDSELAPVDISASGTLESFATVHRHFGKDIVAPFAIGEIRLDAGPFIRATLEHAGTSDLAIGVRVRGALSTGDMAELRFKRMES